jgi:hypothetical protein
MILVKDGKTIDITENVEKQLKREGWKILVVNYFGSQLKFKL